jgi:acetyltransferase-like isoleucine patch superfamily enzyme
MYYSIRKKILKRIINFPFFTSAIRIIFLRKMGLVVGTDLGIGDNIYLSDRSIDKNHIIIEDRVDISANVTFIAASGPRFSKWKYLYEIKSDPIIIKHDVWIGHGVIILPGVTVGEFSIIGAGTIVGGDIPAYSIASGNPMIIKNIPSALRNKLMSLK